MLKICTRRWMLRDPSLHVRLRRVLKPYRTKMSTPTGMYPFQVLTRRRTNQWNTSPIDFSLSGKCPAPLRISLMTISSGPTTRKIRMRLAREAKKGEWPSRMSIKWECSARGTPSETTTLKLFPTKTSSNTSMHFNIQLQRLEQVRKRLQKSLQQRAHSVPRWVHDRKEAKREKNQQNSYQGARRPCSLRRLLPQFDRLVSLKPLGCWSEQQCVSLERWEFKSSEVSLAFLQRSGHRSFIKSFIQCLRSGNSHGGSSTLGLHQTQEDIDLQRAYS